MSKFVAKNIANMIALWRYYGAEQRGDLWYSHSWPHRVWHNSLDWSETSKELNAVQLSASQQLVTLSAMKDETEWQPQDMRKDLRLTLMHLEMPNTKLEVDKDSELELLDSTDTDGIISFVKMSSDGFGYSMDPQALLRAAKFSAVKLGFLRVSGERVATVLLLKQDNTLGIHQVAVPSAFRGKGYATDMMLHSMRWGQTKRAQLITLQASEMGLNLYRRLGFKEAGSITFWRKECTEYP
ncbi:GNAT family N-acetyltransferase [Kangiella sp.]|uniref:GNAT family N-acetyltransferase n=1 Tax=Kangiella sp. TaxID=1920245 RepID=UPI003A94D99B